MIQQDVWTGSRRSESECGALTPDDWATLRDVRLRALKDSPDAYLSTYDVENSWTEDRWRRSFAGSIWVVTRDAGSRLASSSADSQARPIGLARSIQVPGRPNEERHIESVWVDPEYRGKGVMRAILGFLIAAEPKVRDWRLWVIDDNAKAREVYKRLGFKTFEGQSLSDGSGRREEHLRLRLWQAP